MKRIGIIALLHESNTFLEQPTTIEHFRSNLLVSGAEVIDAFRGSDHEVGGILERLENQLDVQAVGVFAARAMPFGRITSGCWQELMDRLQASLHAFGPYDGFLVAPHGATVAETALDADGTWLALLRSWVGREVPIFGTLDLHANVSPKMIRACDGLFAYQTNPHLDQRPRGQTAAEWLLRSLRTGSPVHMGFRALPMAVNIERQATSETQGVWLHQEAKRIERQCDSKLDISCLYGFPYSDVEEMGASVVTVCEGPSSVAQDAADELAELWWQRRSSFRGELHSIDECLQNACDVLSKQPGKPVGLLDMGDNVGGGSPGDGTWIWHRWHEVGKSRLLGVIYDPQVVLEAEKIGPNGTWVGEVGGKLSPELHGPPISTSANVLRLSDGLFSEPGITHGGYRHFDQGRTAVLELANGSTLIVTSMRMAPLSLQQIVSQGVDPSQFDAIVIKGVHAPVAAYQNVCSRLIRVNTRGATSADLSSFEFHGRRQPLYPFEDSISL